ncbi:peroxiredoxin [Homoserinimonas sp. OAct 916]|uniref:peroxiredoxin n=1 Tax=Homoserinimonas sp. OAct 916 TaxID=2211450 RepID=UPI000DBEA5CD|nr:peroxiredoxin [Homoserinimonas sp. OAct 916]
MMGADYLGLPDDLPAPEDDGAADHLPGLRMPPLVLSTTAGTTIRLDDGAPARTVLYFYPMTGRPGVALPAGWDAIPGARGCTPESCGFRDHFRELGEVGASRVYGVSSQDLDYQREAVDRLHLPFPLISDRAHELADALSMPTFVAGGKRLYSRLTMVVRGGTIEHVFYPVFPPDTHAQQVVDWLRTNP